MADVYGDLNDFDKRMNRGKVYRENDDQSSEDEAEEVDRSNPVSILQKKNEMLLDRLYKSEKMLQDMKDTYEAVTGSSDSQKDKKIIELAKKNRQLQLSNEVLKTKAAQAAEFALKVKAETPKLPDEPSIAGDPFPTSSPGPSDDKKLK